MTETRDDDEVSGVERSAGGEKVDAGPPAGRSRRLGLVVAVAVTVVAIDQLTKWWALETLADRQPLEVIGSLQFSLAYNTGAAFSLGNGRNLGPFVGLLAIVVVAFLVRSAATTASLAGAATAGLIAGGAMGNIVDRAFRPGPGLLGGAVVDFIDVQWWPVFNVADMAVCVGALLFVAVGWRASAPAA